MTTKPTNRALEDARSREAAGRLRMPWRKSSGAFCFGYVPGGPIRVLRKPSILSYFAPQSTISCGLIPKGGRAMASLETAIHEAGHAVMAIYFGQLPCDITIESTKEFAGRCYVLQKRFHPEQEGGTWNEWQKAEKFICISSGGYAADLLFGKLKQRGEHRDDLRRCADLLSLMGYDIDEQKNKYLEYLRTTIRILRQPGNWGAVLDLADALIKKGTIEGSEVRVLVETCTRREGPPVKGQLDLPLKWKTTKAFEMDTERKPS